MIIHGIETSPDGHDKCGLLSNRADPGNLTTLPRTGVPGRSLTDRHNPVVVFTATTWKVRTLSNDKNPKPFDVTRPWHRVIRLPRAELTDAERRSPCSTATIRSTSS